MCDSKNNKFCWISVADHLPSEEYDWVLVSYVDKDHPNMRFVPSVGELRNGVWHTLEGDVESKSLPPYDYNFEQEHNVVITHWMEIPEVE